MKKYLFLTALSFIISNYFSFSDTFYHYADYYIGKQPVSLFYDVSNHRLNVFCLGYDANFNGKFDEGDEKPSWWFVPQPGVVVPRIDSLEKIHKIYEFEMGDLKFPLRLGYNLGTVSDNGFVILCVNDTVYSFSIEDASKLHSFGYYQAVDIKIDHSKLLITTSNYQNGNIYLLNPFTYLPIDTLELDYPPNNALIFDRDNKQLLAVLFEGNFGKSDSKIYFYEKNEKWELIKSLELGASGNHLYSDGKYIYIPMNFSHTVNVIDIDSLEIFKTLPTATTFYDGPREIKKLNDDLYVSTYAGDIRKYNTNNWQLTSVYEAYGKVEGIEFINDEYLIAACPFKKSSYEADSVITIFSKTTTLVNEQNPDSKINVSNIKNYINIKSTDNIHSIEIYDLSGALIFSEFNIASNELQIDESHFTSGIYLIKINTINSKYTTKFYKI